MTRVRKLFLFTTLLVVAAGGVVFALVAYVLRSSLPAQDATIALEGLGNSVIVDFDQYGIPRIQAQDRVDAFRALGFVTARDRLFQLDLMRRVSAGRLAEIFGAEPLESDRWHRVMGFEQVAGAIATQLDAAQKEVLRAYTAGVNQAIAQMRVLPFEFLVLGYSPSVWRPEDSLLVVLGMYKMLSWTANDERMATVMEATLPPAVAAFLTPDADSYTKQLLGGEDADRPAQPIPVDGLKQVLAARPAGPHALGMVEIRDPSAGSNAWLVGPERTRKGRAILANDMHLRLGVPNLWYRAEIHYGDVRLAGITLPGVPVLVSGTNRRVAWGFTNIDGDFVDLVAVDPVGGNEYRTPEGSRRFGERVETIHVRGGASESLVVRTTQWGPVLPEPLLGRPVAVHWIALDPVATNLDLMDLDRVRGVQEAMAVFNRAGAPPQNVLIADEDGNIGWTYMGRIPVRVGFDGRVSRSWAEGGRGWNGYVPRDELPRRVNPSSGLLVSANQRMLGGDYPYLIGHNFESGYRAFRITQRVQATRDIEERDMLALQLDTTADFYRYYDRLALEVLAAPAVSAPPGLREYLEAWNGRGDTDSLAFPLLVEFRKTLVEAVFSPLLAACRGADRDFVYAWHTSDAPLQQLLDAKHPELLPDHRYSDWNAFLRAKLEDSARRVMEHHGVESLKDLTWGRVHRAQVAHPMSRALPMLSRFLDMTNEPLAGCSPCVRASAGDHGASERLVVSPGGEENGTLHMPGGQSGHPLSPHYRDQQPNWVQGLPSSFLAGTSRYRLTLAPPRAALAP